MRACVKVLFDYADRKICDGGKGGREIYDGGKDGRGGGMSV